VRRRKVLHADPAMAPLVAELEKVVPERDLGHPLWEAFDTTQPTIVTNVTPDMLAMHVHDERHRTLLAKIGVVSVIVVPLVARGRLLALVTIASTRAEHHYSRDDFRLVLDLARRASLALDNARLYEVAQMAIQARDQVLSVVAHDLRNPLGNILMQVKRACDERGADVIRRAVTRMNRLIQDLLDATRIDARRFSVTPARVATNDMLAECVEAQRPLAASASLELRIDAAADLPDIWADRDQLLRVFENLIGNAIKFTDAGGCITVRASPRDADVLFAVADTGHGLAAKDLPHVFDRFWQASANERRGAGLGLPIVKGIVEAHGGRIWVDSEEGHGTTFSFTIPLAKDN